MTRHRAQPAPRPSRPFLPATRRSLLTSTLVLLLAVLLGGSLAPADVPASAQGDASSATVAEARHGRWLSAERRDERRAERRAERDARRAAREAARSAAASATAIPSTSADGAAGGESVPAPVADVPATTSSSGSAPAPAAAPATAANGAVPAGGMFPLLPPGSALPSSEECAARVQRDSWEPRPGNAAANATRPSGQAPFGMGTWFTAAADGSGYRARVDGNFTGTTDEIIQWASCKWGFPTDLNRAQAVNETWWEQSFVGDGGESFGLYQMRHTTWAGHPNSQASTAFNADWAMGLRRACYDGVMWYDQLRGNLDACIGVHYSGDPDESTWRAYVDRVREHERNKTWLSWSSARGTPPTASRR